jgi:hypothetical protein
VLQLHELDEEIFEDAEGDSSSTQQDESCHHGHHHKGQRRGVPADQTSQDAPERDRQRPAGRRLQGCVANQVVVLVGRSFSDFVHAGNWRGCEPRHKKGEGGTHRLKSTGNAAPVGVVGAVAGLADSGKHKERHCVHDGQQGTVQRGGQ